MFFMANETLETRAYQSEETNWNTLLSTHGDLPISLPDGSSLPLQQVYQNNRLVCLSHPVIELPVRKTYPVIELPVRETYPVFDCSGIFLGFYRNKKEFDFLTED